MASRQHSKLWSSVRGLLWAHQLRIDASSLEELQHEARDALIQHYGPAHVGYRARVRRRVKLMPSGGEHR